MLLIAKSIRTQSSVSRDLLVIWQASKPLCLCLLFIHHDRCSCDYPNYPGRRRIYVPRSLDSGGSRNRTRGPDSLPTTGKCLRDPASPGTKGKLRECWGCHGSKRGSLGLVTRGLCRAISRLLGRETEAVVWTGDGKGGIQKYHPGERCYSPQISKSCWSAHRVACALRPAPDLRNVSRTTLCKY